MPHVYKTSTPYNLTYREISETRSICRHDMKQNRLCNYSNGYQLCVVVFSYREWSDNETHRYINGNGVINIGTMLLAAAFSNGERLKLTGRAQ